jgi:hypothetical protein
MCDTQHSHSLNGRHRNRNQLLVTLFLQGPSYHAEATIIQDRSRAITISPRNRIKERGMGRGDSPRRTAGPRGGRKRRRRRGRGEARLGFGPAQGSAGYKGARWSEGFLPGRRIYVLLTSRLNHGRPILRGIPTELSSLCGRSAGLDRTGPAPKSSSVRTLKMTVKACLVWRLGRHTAPNLWRPKRPPHPRQKKVRRGVAGAAALQTGPK